METLSSVLEFAMLLTFGLSWPFAIVRTYRAKRVDGKSPLFAILVILGYLCGIAAKIVGHKPLWLVAIYVVDTLLVSTDLVLYFYYSSRSSHPKSA